MSNKAKVGYDLFKLHKDNALVHVTPLEKARWNRSKGTQVFETIAERDAADTSELTPGSNCYVKDADGSMSKAEFWWDGSAWIEDRTAGTVNLEGYVKTVNGRGVETGTNNVILNTGNIPESTNKKYVTDAEKSKFPDITKVEASSTNGNVKINGAEVTIYEEIEIEETDFNALTTEQQKAKNYIITPDSV